MGAAIPPSVFSNADFIGKGDRNTTPDSDIQVDLAVRRGTEDSNTLKEARNAGKLPVLIGHNPPGDGCARPGPAHFAPRAWRGASGILDRLADGTVRRSVATVVCAGGTRLPADDRLHV